MTDFNIRSESVDVEQIMQQIRSRIREKRGADYTEDQVRELAAVRLETFLDPKNLRSDLLEQFRRSRPAIQDDPPPVDAPYEFNDETLFASHRGPLRLVRKLLKPLLKLFFNPNTLNQILHTQAQFNVDVLKREQRRRIEFERSRADWNALYYEVLHNLVLETTRNGIELKNLRMRIEALTSRLDFSERRVRALEGVVQYRPEAVRHRERDRERRGAARPDNDLAPEPQDQSLVPTGEGAPPLGTGLAAEGRRRRRRRRGRRSGERPEMRLSTDAANAADEGGDPREESLSAGDDSTDGYSDDRVDTSPGGTDRSIPERETGGSDPDAQ